MTAAPLAAGRLFGAATLGLVLVLFGVSGGMLWTLGLNYDGLSGSAASKIHPATYGAALLAAALLLARGPVRLLSALLVRHPGAVAFAAVALFQAGLIALQGRPNLAAAFDTYLLACVLAVAVAELDGGWRRRVEVALHLILAANAALALVELAADHRVWPYRFEGEAFETDARSAAFQGHPLVNAVVTGTYVLLLLSGAGPALKRSLRAPAILLQLAALVAFGGRTALILVTAALALKGGAAAWRLLRGGRVPLRAAAAASLLLPLGALGLAGLAAGGFFDAALARFGDDGGSAQARVGMLDLLAALAWRDLLVGPSAELVDSLRRTEGLEWGIENPIVRLLLYQGAIVTAFLTAGFALFLCELGARARGAGPAFLFFVVTVNSFESLASKTTLLAKFAVLVIAMAPAAVAAAQPASRPSAARSGRSRLRAASSA